MNETTQNPSLKKPTFSWGMWEVMKYSMCWTARRAREEESRGKVMEQGWAAILDTGLLPGVSEKGPLS